MVMSYLTKDRDINKLQAERKGNACPLYLKSKRKIANSFIAINAIFCINKKSLFLLIIQIILIINK